MSESPVSSEEVRGASKILSYESRDPSENSKWRQYRALVHTLDIACTGVRLGGLRSQPRMGDTVVLHRGSKCEVFGLSGFGS
jgi:hypothetical protein